MQQDLHPSDKVGIAWALMKRVKDILESTGFLFYNALHFPGEEIRIKKFNNLSGRRLWNSRWRVIGILL